MKVKMRCTSSNSIKFEELSLIKGKLKKHSVLEIERVKESIIEDGFLFPIAIGALDGKNYILDGECRYYALSSLIHEGWEVDEVPVYYVKVKKETLKKVVLIAASTNHAVTENSLLEFVKGTSINLKNFGFADSFLIDFHTGVDIGLYVETIGGKSCEKELKESDFEGLLE